MPCFLLNFKEETMHRWFVYVNSRISNMCVLHFEHVCSSFRTCVFLISNQCRVFYSIPIFKKETIPRWFISKRTPEIYNSLVPVCFTERLLYLFYNTTPMALFFHVEGALGFTTLILSLRSNKTNRFRPPPPPPLPPHTHIYRTYTYTHREHDSGSRSGKIFSNMYFQVSFVGLFCGTQL